jgi:hypothetical protein
MVDIVAFSADEDELLDVEQDVAQVGSRPLRRARHHPCPPRPGTPASVSLRRRPAESCDVEPAHRSDADSPGVCQRSFGPELSLLHHKRVVQQRRAAAGTFDTLRRPMVVNGTG